MLLVFLFVYMIVYNIALLLIFWTLQQFISSNFKTLHSFRDLRLEYYAVAAFTISFLSAAGVPPFLGFFSKLLILLALVRTDYLFFYLAFFGLLFFGLYFYMQNLRFLHSTGAGRIAKPHGFGSRAVTLYFLLSSLLFFVLVFGGVFLDSFLLYICWIFA